MALSAFDDKSSAPAADRLAGVLGRASPSWRHLLEALAAQYAPLTEVWAYGGRQWGWSLRVLHGKRTIVWLTPCRSHFIAGLALGERAVQAAQEADLPAPVLEIINGARRYAEGRAVRLEVRTKKDAAAVLKVAAAKMAN